jgi:uncharacterized membrane protein YesL
MNENPIGWAGRLMEWLQFGACLVLVNILFVAGTLAGLVLFGLFPAAVAATALLARLRAGAAGDHLVRDFITAYRAQFWHVNRVGSIFWPAAVVLFLNALSVLGRPSGGSAPAMEAVLLVLTVAAGAGTLAAAATAVAICSRYRDTVLRTWRLAFVLPLVSPLMSLSLLASLVALTVVFAGMSVLVPLIGASVPLLLSGWLVGRRLGTLQTAA